MKRPFDRYAQARGFTVLELMTVCGIMAVVMAIAYPQIASISGQMRSSQDTRLIAKALEHARAEAIRLRTNARIKFSATNVRWDVNDDGSFEGTYTLSAGSTWLATVPADIVFNGLGLARGIAGTTTITIRNRGFQNRFTVNSNGHVEI